MFNRLNHQTRFHFHLFHRIPTCTTTVTVSYKRGIPAIRNDTITPTRIPPGRRLLPPSNPSFRPSNPDTKIPILCPQKHNRIPRDKLLMIHKRTPSRSKQMPPRRPSINMPKLPRFAVHVFR
ncbi:hypothetical protein HanRHA438_Chr13g0595291 [Helianthus annuus]|nr:hypothetical protein HanRHA438_Chr13g0595291 [Helianthus annuus]